MVYKECVLYRAVVSEEKNNQGWNDHPLWFINTYCITEEFYIINNAPEF